MNGGRLELYNQRSSWQSFCPWEAASHGIELGDTITSKEAQDMRENNFGTLQYEHEH
jgi:hypothetical protein